MHCFCSRSFSNCSHSFNILFEKGQESKMQAIEEIKQFLKSKGMADKTIKTYASILSKVIYQLGYSFTEQQVEDWLTKQNFMPRTYNLVRTIVSFYTNKYLGYKLRFEKAKVPKHIPTYVTLDEFRKMLITIPNLKHRIAFELMYCGGLRVEEVSNLRMDNIDFNTKKIKVRGKGDKERHTILRGFLTTALKRLIGDNDKNNPYLFQTYRGHIHPRSLQERLKTAKKDTHILKRFTCHDLRHSFAVNLLKRGTNIEQVRRLLGHSSLRTTQIYLQCIDEDLTELVNHLDGNITKCTL